MTLASLLAALRAANPQTLAYVYEAHDGGIDCVDAGELDELKVQRCTGCTVLSTKPEYFPDQDRRGIEIIVEVE